MIAHVATWRLLDLILFTCFLFKFTNDISIPANRGIYAAIAETFTICIGVIFNKHSAIGCTADIMISLLVQKAVPTVIGPKIRIWPGHQRSRSSTRRGRLARIHRQPQRVT